MKTLKNARVWSIFFANIALRVLPERVKHQHRVADIGLWLSAFPKDK
jgi:hypothetical protein